MKHTNKALTFSPDIWDLMKNVPTKELETVLRKAFPQYLPKAQVIKTAEANKTARKLRLVEELRNAKFSKPVMDPNEAMRQTDEEFSI
ncbi:MAG: hypothetical protein V4543_07795 [Bacteroidota bacterium]